MFFWYLRDRRTVLFLLLLLLFIFIVVFALFRIPLPPILYAGALFCVVAVPVAVRDFLWYRRRHHRMAGLCESSMVLPEDLPPAGSLGEQDDQALVLRLCRELEENHK